MSRLPVVKPQRNCNVILELASKFRGASEAMYFRPIKFESLFSLSYYEAPDKILMDNSTQNAISMHNTSAERYHSFSFI